jgi:effector-binding domain-containing protein
MRTSLKVSLAAAVLICASGFGAASGQAIAVTIQQVEPFPYICLPSSGGFEQIEAVIGQMWQSMQEQNIFPMGGMIGVYHSDPTMIDFKNLKWEVGFPVSEQASPLSPLEKRHWIFTTVASAMYVGPYDKTGDAIVKMYEWIFANGYTADGPILEKYMDMDPSKVDPNALKTEIWIPVKKK